MLDSLGQWPWLACSFRRAQAATMLEFHVPLTNCFVRRWFCVVRKLHCTITIDSVLANCKTQNAFLFPVHAMFHHDCPLAVKPASMPRRLVHKKTWRDSLPIDMLLSAVSVLVVAQPSSEFPEGLLNYPVYKHSTISFIYISIVHECFNSSRSLKGGGRWESTFWGNANVTGVTGDNYTIPIVCMGLTTHICTTTACILLCS